MADYILSCCSTADLSEKHFNEQGINYICFHFEMDGVEYTDDLGKSIPFPDFYRKMEEGVVTKTSQVNTQEFVDYFEKFLKEGKDILHVCLSSGLSGVINSANIARDILIKKYPERKIYVVDSLGASSGYGLIMDTLADMKKQGKTIDELFFLVEDHKLELHHWFFSTTLKYYVSGGRISRTSGFIGNVLRICPLLNMNYEGKLTTRDKIRTKKKVIAEIVNRMEQYAKDGLDYSGKCFISNSACEEDARAVADLIEAKFPKLNGKVLINSVGTTIGSHTGPGTVALFFWGKKRTD